MNDKNRRGTEPPQDENQIIAERRAKLARLREGGQAFPNDFRRTHLAADLQAAHGDKTKEELEGEKPAVAIAGRMLLKRVMGKASFATLQDMSGRIQIYVNNDVTGVDAHEAFKHWDLGDILGAEGTLFRTQDGRAHAPGDEGAAAVEVAAAAAGEVARPHRHGAALPPALRGPHRQSRSRARCSSSARSSCRRSASSSSRAATSRSRRRCCIRSPAVPPPSPSRRTTTRSTCSCTCASRRSCT